MSRGKRSPSDAKSTIAKALRGLLSRNPTKIQLKELWTFFEGKCAYCDKRLVRKTGDCHIDHLVAESAGGSNHISNRVYACGVCNSHEKRETDWRKTASPEKTAKIEEWISKFPPLVGYPTLEAFCNQAIADVVKVFDEKVKEIRSLNDSVL